MWSVLRRSEIILAGLKENSEIAHQVSRIRHFMLGYEQGSSHLRSRNNTSIRSDRISVLGHNFKCTVGPRKFLLVQINVIQNKLLFQVGKNISNNNRADDIPLPLRSQQF